VPKTKTEFLFPEINATGKRACVDTEETRYPRTFTEEMGGEQKKRLRRDSKDVDKRCQPNQFEKLDR